MRKLQYNALEFSLKQALMTLIGLILIFFLLAFGALFSVTETAITAASPGRIQKLVSKGNKSAKRIKELLQNKGKAISALLIGNSIANTLCTTVATSIFIELLGDNVGTLISSIVMSFAIIVFSEVIPKALAVRKPEQIALFIAPAALILMQLLKPLNVILEYCIRLTIFIFRIDISQNISGTDEVRGIIEHHHNEGNVVKDDLDMLGGILDIRNLIVGDIMIHRSKINSINIDLPKDNIVKLALNSEHTRIPLWQDTPNNIIGILHIRDLMKAIQNVKGELSKLHITSLLTAPWFVSNNSLITHQLEIFREGQTHIACVVDEYGELMGIITLEDILEEIVGQIYDEYDIGKNKVLRVSNNHFTVDGAAAVRDLNRELGWDIPETVASSIGGFLLRKMKRIPSKGESISVGNLKLIVKTKSANRVKTITVLVETNESHVF